MSKKNSKGQQSKGEEMVDLANLKVASVVNVVLPDSIKSNQMNLPLIEGYLRNKLSNKKVVPGQHFVALFKGK